MGFTGQLILCDICEKGVPLHLGFSPVCGTGVGACSIQSNAAYICKKLIIKYLNYQCDLRIFECTSHAGDCSNFNYSMVNYQTVSTKVCWYWKLILELMIQLLHINNNASYQLLNYNNKLYMSGNRLIIKI